MTTFNKTEVINAAINYVEGVYTPEDINLLKALEVQRAKDKKAAREKALALLEAKRNRDAFDW